MAKQAGNAVLCVVVTLGIMRLVAMMGNAAIEGTSLMPNLGFLLTPVEGLSNEQMMLAAGAEFVVVFGIFSMFGKRGRR